MPRTEQQIMKDWRFALMPMTPHREKETSLEIPDIAEAPNENEFMTITLPHDWACNRPFDKSMEQGGAQGFLNRWGIGWYRRTLQMEKKQKGYLYYLHFGGIFENSTIWVNGQYAGGRKYGYSSFRVDITKLLRQGTNELLIKVDNSVTTADRWYSGCGIYRTVKLVTVEETHLDPWEVIVDTKLKLGETSEQTKAVINIDVSDAMRVGEASWKQADVEKSDLQVQAVLHRKACEAEVMQPVVEKIEAAGKQITLILTNPSLWTAETPNLYTLELTLLKKGVVCDCIRQNIGIRRVEFIPQKGMFVNGQRVLLKGVCLHQEAGCVGIAAKREVWEARLKQLKEMGCNAIRAAHHTHSEEFMDLCDEMGFYVYEECFDKWVGGLYGRYFETQWEQDVEAMVKRDRNRPSVVIWGVGNEVENQAHESMLQILQMLSDKVKSLDSSRPVTYAMNPHFKRESNVDLSKVKDIQQFVDEVSDTEIYDNEERIQRISRIGEIVDIISCNYQEQWYPLIHEAMPDKLILGTEIYQYFCGHPDQMQNFTDTNPNLVPEQYEYCIGSMIWTGYDYLGESVVYPAKGWAGSMIRTNGERRPSYYILQSYWTKEPMVHFSVLDYTLGDEGVKEHWDIPPYADHWHFPQYHKMVVPYMIASNCEEVELYLNEKRFYIAKPAESANRLITGFLPYQSGKVTVIGRCGGQEVCRQITVTPGPAVKLQFDNLVTEIPSEPGYEILLSVHALDAEGNRYYRESTMVHFRVDGPAEIIGVDNGDMMSHEPYNEQYIHMYRGCASVMLRMKKSEKEKDGERVSVWADGAGLASGAATIVVK